MNVEIKVFATLRHYIPESERRVEKDLWKVTEKTTVAQVLEILRIPLEEAKVLLINGKKAELGRALAEGDVLHVFPPMCGG
jgi:molybdopterin converting factor small subunit